MLGLGLPLLPLSAGKPFAVSPIGLSGPFDCCQCCGGDEIRWSKAVERKEGHQDEIH